MGTPLPPDPTRIAAKRLILTGHPFKIHKKTATIRYMFFDRDDVDFFKPIELHTKLGKVGHITEALGTHGYFKAHFDGPIQGMDTVCMNLYKRQFPKVSSLHDERGKVSADRNSGQRNSNRPRSRRLWIGRVAPRRMLSSDKVEWM
jgi:hypothetical protein